MAKGQGWAMFRSEDGKTISERVANATKKLERDGVIYSRVKKEAPKSRAARAGDVASSLNDLASDLRGLYDEWVEAKDEVDQATLDLENPEVELATEARIELEEKCKAFDERDWDGEASAILERLDFSDIEELAGEMENWRDSIPENLQGGDKYCSVDEAASVLSDVQSELESVSCSSIEEAEDAVSVLEDQASNLEGVEFPGMFG